MDSGGRERREGGFGLQFYRQSTERRGFLIIIYAIELTIYPLLM